MSNVQTIVVTSEHVGKRLDHLLAQHFSHISRSQLQRLIKTGAILLDGKQVPPHHFLKPGEEIQIDLDEPTKTRAESNVATQKQSDVSPLDLIAEEPDFVIVNKPAGILVHPLEHIHEWTLIDQVLERFPEIRQVGEDPLRPGIVHRLDRDVSGVMVVARTWEMYEHLKAAFASREVHKEYTALVHGIPAQAEGEIAFSLERSKRRPGRMAAKPEGKGKLARTRFEVLKSFRNYSLLKVLPLTGRTHQIRVHLRAFGYPIVGDDLYHPRHRKNDLGAKRPMLASTQLGFRDLKGRERAFTVTLPDDMRVILERL